jgi:hypothetical protein
VAYNPTTQVTIADGRSLDAFGRLRVASPTTSLFDGQLTYDLQPLIYEAITNGSGATVTHDATNRRALMTFSSTPTGGKAFMQTYQYFRYQPGKSQNIAITFNMGDGVANVEKFAGYSDGTDGIEFVMLGTTPSVRILSSSSNGNNTVAQSSWNIDKLDGTGVSGITLDISKGLIFVLDFQALYTGRVRVGFNINGIDYYCHYFNHANIIAAPYIANANLPIRCGMTCTGTVSTTMHYHCSTASSEGGFDDTSGYHFSMPGSTSLSAGSSTRTHALSIRPKTTFNSIANRTRFVFETVSLAVTGTNPVYWEVCLGQAISGTTTYNDINTTYSAYEYNIAGTISGSPVVVIASGYINGSNQAKGADNYIVPMRYPITLDAAGAVRANGTLSFVVTGIGGASGCLLTTSWKEIR